jgi:hypothetical protein
MPYLMVFGLLDPGTSPAAELLSIALSYSISLADKMIKK